MSINKRMIGIFIGCVVVGVLVGYGIWGEKENGKTDVKRMLNKVVQEVDRIEHKNRELRDELDKSKSDASDIANMLQENQQLKVQLQKTQQDRQDMGIAVEEMKRRVAEAENEVDALKERVVSSEEPGNRAALLEQETRELRVQLENALKDIEAKDGLLDQARNELAQARQQAMTGEELKVLSDDLKGRIDSLEKENQELKSVIEKIGVVIGGEQAIKPAE